MTKKYQKNNTVRDDLVKFPDKQGNGYLRYSVIVNKNGKLVRYSLTYINFNLYAQDNGRVLGYDNCHGHHHKHYMGEEEEIEFISFEDIQNQFEREWEALHEKAKKRKKY